MLYYNYKKPLKKIYTKKVLTQKNFSIKNRLKLNIKMF